MANMSNYLENKLIDHIFRNVSYTAPTVLSVALCTAAPDDTSTGATITEVANSASYARTSLNQSTTNWASTGGATTTTNPSAGTGGTTSNNSAITFPTATGSWGVVTHIAICDSATWGAGNVLFWAPLSVNKTVTNGDTLSFAISQLTCQIDN